MRPFSDKARSQGFAFGKTADWNKDASDPESEMLKRGMFFEVIDSTEDQAILRFDE